MSVTSYRLYCNECSNETVVLEDEVRRDTHWKVESFIHHKGLCPRCNPTKDLSEIENRLEYEEDIELESLDGIGDKAASNLRRAGISTVETVKELPDDRILDVSWVGDKALESLKERANS